VLNLKVGQLFESALDLLEQTFLRVLLTPFIGADRRILTLVDKEGSL